MIPPRIPYNPAGRPDQRAAGRRQYYPSPARVPQAYGWNLNDFEQPGCNAPVPANDYPAQIYPVVVRIPFGTVRLSPSPSKIGPRQWQQQPQGSERVFALWSSAPSTTSMRQPGQQQHIQEGYGTVG